MVGFATPGSSLVESSETDATIRSMISRVPGVVLAIVLIGALACDRGVREPAAAPLPAGPPPAAATQSPPATTQDPAPAAAQSSQTVPVGPPPERFATKLPTAEIRASLPPLPSATFALPRPVHDVRLAYEFAGLHPEVLKYVPCFCGCEQTGHPHNESCFVAQRDQDGRVVSWDAHGMG
jgi:hypothetical protein